MALINTSLPNLIQGVSQQPTAIRYDGQCEEQENALSSVVDGLVKRPNTRHVARLLESAISSNAKVHFINRAEDERYVVIHDGALRIFNLDTGVEATITDDTAVGLIMGDTWSDIVSPISTVNTFETFQQSTEVNEVTDTIEAINSSGYGLMHLDILDTLEAGDSVEVSFTVDEIIGTDWTVDIRRENINQTGFVNDTDETVQPITTAGDKEFNFTITGNVGSNTAGVFFHTNTIGNSIKIRGLKVSKGGSSNYLTSGITNPREELDFLTVADYTFVTNKTTDVEKSSTKTPDYSGDALVFLKQIGYKVDYNVSTNLGSAQATTGTSDASQNGNFSWNLLVTTFHGDDALQADRVMYGVSGSNGTFSTKNGLAPLLNNLAGIYSTSLGGKTILVRGHTTISVQDSMSGEGLGLVWKQVDSISNLPLTGISGLVVEVAGDSELNQDNYFVKFVTNDGSPLGRGYWEETVAPNSSVGLDPQTMPHQIVNTGLNTFSLTTIPLERRSAGDDDTNPHPSFVGKKINSIFFFKNRLGFVTNDSVVMSEAGHFFNFYRKTVTTLLDDAPIDISVASTKVTNLNSAVGFQGNLLLFADNQQFVLKGGDVLTSKTVSINSATSFDADSAVKPLALGSYVYFPFSRGAFTGVREFAVDASTDNFNAVEITDHVPSYIPKNIIDISGTASEDMLVFLSGDEKNSLYVYNYFWNNTQKVLSAWSKFTFEGEVRGVEFIESTLHVVLTHNNETQLLELPLESGLKDPVGYNTYLDQRVETTVLAGDDTITLPYTPAPEDTIEVYTKDGLKLSSSRTGSTVTLTQAVTEDTDVWLGYPFTMKYTFSELLFKASTGNSKSPSNAAKLKIRNGSVFYNDTAYFKVSVTPLHRDTYENSFTPDVVGSTTLGELNLDSGAYRFPVFSNAEDTKITITNDSALPSNFTSAEFESFVHSRSNRYAR